MTIADLGTQNISSFCQMLNRQKKEKGHREHVKLQTTKHQAEAEAAAQTPKQTQRRHQVSSKQTRGENSKQQTAKQTQKQKFKLRSRGCIGHENNTNNKNIQIQVLEAEAALTRAVLGLEKYR